MLNKMNLTSQIFIELSGKYPNMTSRSGEVYSIQHYEQRYIAGSAKCSTKPLSKLLKFRKFDEKREITPK
jgi:hypothetical protein